MLLQTERQTDEISLPLRYISDNSQRREKLSVKPKDITSFLLPVWETEPAKGCSPESSFCEKKQSSVVPKLCFSERKFLQNRFSKILIIVMLVLSLLLGAVPHLMTVSNAESITGVYDGGTSAETAVELQTTPTEGTFPLVKLRNGWYKVSGDLTVSNCLQIGKYYADDPDVGEVHLIINPGVTLTLNTNGQPGLWACDYPLIISGGGTIKINTSGFGYSAIMVDQNIQIVQTKIEAISTKEYAGVDVCNGSLTLSSGAELSSNLKIKVSGNQSVTLNNAKISSDAGIEINTNCSISAADNSTISGIITGNGTKTITDSALDGCSVTNAEITNCTIQNNSTVIGGSISGNSTVTDSNVSRETVVTSSSVNGEIYNAIGKHFMASLSNVSSEYTGTIIVPGISVKEGDADVSDENYDVTWTLADQNAEIKNAGTYIGTVTGKGDYAGCSAAAGTFTVTQRALKVMANPKNITYGEAPADDGVMYETFAGTEDQSVLGGSLSFSIDYAQYGDIGSYTITPSGLTSDNYAVSFESGVLSVEPKEISISWGETELVYNGELQVPAVSVSNAVNGDEIRLTVEGGEKDAGGDYLATVTGISGEKAANYKLPDSGLSKTFNIDPAQWIRTNVSGQAKYGNSGTVDLTEQTAPNGVYGELTINDPENVLAGSPALGPDGKLVFSFVNDAEAVGKQASVTIPVTGSGNYLDYEILVTLTVQSKETGTLAVTQVGTGYGGAELPAPVYSKPAEGGTETLIYSGTLRKDGSSYGPSAAAPAEAGDYSVSVTYETNETIYFGSAAFVIEPRSIADAVVRLDQTSFVYSGTEQKVSVTEVSLEGQVLSANDYEVSGDFAGTNRGSYTVFVRGMGNYSGEAMAEWSIEAAAPGVTPPSPVQGLIYSGEAQKLVSTGSAENGTILYSLKGGAFGEEVPEGKDAGNYSVSWYVKGNENYADSGSESEPLGSMTVIIAQKTVTVTADNMSKTEGEDDPALNAKVDGTLDSGTVSYEISRESGERAGTYVITVSGEANQGNYTVNFVNGIFTIKAKDQPEKPKAVVIQQPEGAQNLEETGDAQELLCRTVKAEGGTVMYSVNGSPYSTEQPKGTHAGSYVISWYVAGDSSHSDLGSPEEPCGRLTVEIGARKYMVFPVDIVIVQGDGSHGVPKDVKPQTVSLTILIKQGNDVVSGSEMLKIEVTPGENTQPVKRETVKFTPYIENFAETHGKYEQPVVMLSPEKVKADIAGTGDDVPVYELKAVAGFNGEKFTVTLFWTLETVPEPAEVIRVVALPEDEIGAYALREDGTKEYLIFQTYDICMAYLGRDELCTGPERCYHK